MVRRYVTLAALAATACASGPAADGIHRQNDVRHYDISPLLQPLSADASLTPVRPGGRRPEPRRWDTADVAPDGRTLLVRYFDDCGWLDGAEAAETDTSVTVTVRVAGAADAGDDAVCLGPAETHVARVELDRPLRGRLMLDGSDGSPRPVLRLRG